MLDATPDELANIRAYALSFSREEAELTMVVPVKTVISLLGGEEEFEDPPRFISLFVILVLGNCLE